MTAAATLVAALTLAGGSQATVAPVVGAREGLVHVTLTGVPAAAVQARIGGGVASRGKWLGWVPLVSAGPASWRSVLRAPGYLGVYPLQVRTAGTIADAGPLVRILPRRFARQPGFFTPVEVAEWWAQTSPRNLRLVSAAEWHAGFYAHRDARFNRLVRATVRLPAGAGTETRYVSVARLRVGGPWRMLEVVEAP
jgi:hypothetical protein